jgi:predicted esterase
VLRDSRAVTPYFPEPHCAATCRLCPSEPWIGGGKFDPIVPASETRQLVKLLRNAGADVTIQFLEGGHELTRHDVDAARKWLTTFE